MADKSCNRLLLYILSNSGSSPVHKKKKMCISNAVLYYWYIIFSLRNEKIIIIHHVIFVTISVRCLNVNIYINVLSFIVIILSPFRKILIQYDVFTVWFFRKNIIKTNTLRLVTRKKRIKKNDNSFSYVP